MVEILISIVSVDGYTSERSPLTLDSVPHLPLNYFS